MSKAGKKIIAGLNDVLAIVQGKAKKGSYRVHSPKKKIAKKSQPQA